MERVARDGRARERGRARGPGRRVLRLALAGAVIGAGLAGCLRGEDGMGDGTQRPATAGPDTWRGDGGGTDPGGPGPDGRVPGTGVEPIPPPLEFRPGMASPLDQVLAQDSSAALILFLARNPDSPEAGAARAALAARRQPDPAGVAARDAGADAGVVAAFDAARLAGTAAAWAGFLAAHGGHPLAAEARFWMP